MRSRIMTCCAALIALAALFSFLPEQATARLDAAAPVEDCADAAAEVFEPSFIPPPSPAVTGTLIIDGEKSVYIPIRDGDGNTLLSLEALGALGCVAARGGTGQIIVTAAGELLRRGDPLFPPLYSDGGGALFVGLEYVRALTGAAVTEDYFEFTVNADTGGATTDAAARALAEALSLPYAPEDEVERLYLYIVSNPGISPDMAAVSVATGLDRPFYSEVGEIADPDDILVLCNKYNSLSSKFKPSGLKSIGGGYSLRREAADAFGEMLGAMKKDGLYLTVRSAYRSWLYQKNLYAIYRERDPENVDSYSARAGFSEHQTGLAVDILQSAYPGAGLSAAGFENTAQYFWLQENAHLYGFIERYPAGWEWMTGYKAEPWHWRYIGVEAATYMRDHGIATFEEYVVTVLDAAR